MDTYSQHLALAARCKGWYFSSNLNLLDFSQTEKKLVYDEQSINTQGRL
jgi:hypothetical protein